MKILFERHGGFAGLKMATSIDVDSLPDEDAEKLRDLLDEADFFDLPELILPARPVPDEFTYIITVEKKERHHTIRVSDSAASEDLKALLNDLSFRARQQRI
jgi:hypothetical protein